MASVLLAIATSGVLVLGEARVAAAPSSGPPDRHAAILTADSTVAAVPDAPAHPDVSFPVAVVPAAAHLTPCLPLLRPAHLDRAPQPKAPLYLRELVLLL